MGLTIGDSSANFTHSHRQQPYIVLFVHLPANHTRHLVLVSAVSRIRLPSIGTRRTLATILEYSSKEVVPLASLSTFQGTRNSFPEALPISQYHIYLQDFQSRQTHPALQSDSRTYQIAFQTNQYSSDRLLAAVKPSQSAVFCQRSNCNGATTRRNCKLPSVSSKEPPSL